MTYGLNESLNASSFGGGQPPVQVQRVGGWKLLVGGMLAAAGLGFAGYVYLAPYQQLRKELTARTAELGEERTAAEELAAERDKLKVLVSERESVDRDRAASESKKQQSVEGFTSDMKTPLAAFGATITATGGRAHALFPIASMFEQPTSTVISPQGDAALKVLAAAVKKSGFRVRAMAKLIATPPPKELANFKNIGEFTMLRAVRVALALTAAGVSADRIAAAGATAGTGAGGHKARPALPDHLEIEIEPE